MKGGRSFWRALFGKSDERTASEAERGALRRASGNPGVQDDFKAAMDTARQERNVVIGQAALSPSLDVRLRFSEALGHGHGLVLGGNGTGKTRLVAGIVRWLVAENAANPEAVGVWIQDHKSEFVALLRELLGDMIQTLPNKQAEALLGRIVVIDPFSSSSLVPMQVLKPEPGMRPEEQAFEVTTIINRMGGADLGIRQDDYTYHLVLLGVTTGKTLPAIAELLSDPIALAQTARSSPHDAVRNYFGAVDRKQLTQGSLEGVRARLNKLLRLPSTRLMLDAPGSLSFKQLLAENIVLVDVGSPPFGCEDIGRFWSGLVTLKLTRAIFERTHADAKRPVAVAIDEWQEGLAAGGDIAEHYERVLAMARSRGVSLWLVSQSLAGAAKVSSTLPKVVATNTNVQMCFRASAEDARAMSHLLPVSGRRPRPQPAPWEEASRVPYLSRNEELELLTREITTLPDRTFYFWNRRSGGRAELSRAADVSAKGTKPSSAIVRRLRDGILGVPVPELENDIARREQSIFRIVDPHDVLIGPARKPRH
jgi:hypothetical protein